MTGETHWDDHKQGAQRKTHRKWVALHVSLDFVS